MTDEEINNASKEELKEFVDSFWEQQEILTSIMGALERIVEQGDVSLSIPDEVLVKE